MAGATVWLAGGSKCPNSTVVVQKAPSFLLKRTSQLQGTSQLSSPCGYAWMLGDRD
jgi:hypothetical protein